MVPLLGGLALSACKPMLAAVDPLASGDWSKASVAYGPDPHQMLDLYRPVHAHALPIILFLPNEGPGIQDVKWAENLASQGFVVAVVSRRHSPVAAFAAYISDGARALAWMVQNATLVGGSADRLAAVGRGAGANAALMMVRDERYLAAVSMPGRIKAVARMDLVDSVDASFTDPSAYSAGQDIPVWTGTSGDQASLEAYLKAHL